MQHSMIVTEPKRRRQLPEYVWRRIEERVQKIIEKYPDLEEIYLVGSYCEGWWVDENTDEAFTSYRDLNYKRSRISDFDFRCVPLVIDKFEDIELTHSRNVYEKLVYPI